MQEREAQEQSATAAEARSAQVEQELRALKQLQVPLASAAATGPVTMHSDRYCPRASTAEEWAAVQKNLYQQNKQYADATPDKAGFRRSHLYEAALKMESCEQNYCAHGLTVMPYQARLFAKDCVGFLHGGLPKTAGGNLDVLIRVLAGRYPRAVLDDLDALRAFGSRAAHESAPGDPGQPLLAEEKPLVVDALFRVAAYLTRKNRCEDCGQKSANFGLPADRRKRWCSACSRAHSGAVSLTGLTCEVCLSHLSLPLRICVCICASCPCVRVSMCLRVCVRSLVCECWGGGGTERQIESLQRIIRISD